MLRDFIVIPFALVCRCQRGRVEADREQHIESNENFGRKRFTVLAWHGYALCYKSISCVFRVLKFSFSAPLHKFHISLQNFPLLLYKNTINFLLQLFSSFFTHFSSFRMLIQRRLFFLLRVRLFFSLCCSFSLSQLNDEILREVSYLLNYFQSFQLNVRGYADIVPCAQDFP